MSCKLELELCGYVKDNCTKALDVCDFECEDSEIQEVISLLISLFGFVVVCIFLPGYCWYSREQAKKQKQKDRLELERLRSTQLERPRSTQPVTVPYTDNRPQIIQDQSGMRTDRFGNTIDRFGRTIVIAEPKVPSLPQNHRSLNQPTVF